MATISRTRTFALFAFFTAAIALLPSAAICQEEEEEENAAAEEVKASASGISIKYFGVEEGRITFSYKNERGNLDLYILDFGNREITPLLQLSSQEEYPSWSPDGQSVLFYSNFCGNPDVFTIGADGRNLKRLTRHSGVDEDPDWSPDGKRIVFQSDRLDIGKANIFVMDKNGGNIKALTELKKHNTVPRWSPRGDEIVYSTSRFWPGWDLILLNLKTKKSKRLTEGFRSYCRARWHPHGGSFAFSHGGGKEIDLWLHDKGTGTASKLTTRPGKEYDPTWVEDGSQLFFAGEVDPGNYQLFLLNLDEKEPIQVTSGSGSLRQPSWTSLPAPPLAGDLEPLPEEMILKRQVCSQ